MAGQIRHLKVKGGRFHVRVAVPVRLQSIMGQSKLTALLGGNHLEAMKTLPGKVETMLKQI